MCVMTYYDTQKFNLHHGSFGGAKGMGIGCMDDLNIGVHHKQQLGWLTALFGGHICDMYRMGDMFRKTSSLRLNGLITYELNATYCV